MSSAEGAALNSNLDTDMGVLEELEGSEFSFKKELDIQASMKDPGYIEARKKEINAALAEDMCKYLFTSGYIEFESYEVKREFLNSVVASFGLSLQRKVVKFVDADFMNLLGIVVKKERNLRVIDLCTVLNKSLGRKGSEVEPLEVPDFMFYDSKKEEMYTETLDGVVYVRFNSFDQLSKAQKIIERGKVAL